jgi:hypothetical protein
VMDPADYVLQSLNKSERVEFDHVAAKAAESLVVLLLEGLPKAMDRLQRKLTLPSQSP